MLRATVPKERLDAILESLKGEYRLAAPVMEDGVMVYKDIQDVSEVRLNDGIAYKSPKEFLFPQVEEILVFDEDGGVKAVLDRRKTIILGIKPCDLQALKVLTAVFTKGRFADAYFSQRLENTVLIGIGCIEEKQGCFCREVGVYKDFSSDCDIFLQDRGDYYSVAVLTDKGRELFEKTGIEMNEEGQEENPSEKKDAALNIEADENTLFSKIDWEKISERCLACGICTYICPTCHCFEFKDVAKGGKSVRHRCWDSCMYPKFTLHASGHNPRTSKKERYRQRVLHKYLYIKQNFGCLACTGCGRCIRSCPAGMNIKSVVREIMEELK